MEVQNVNKPPVISCNASILVFTLDDEVPEAGPDPHRRRRLGQSPLHLHLRLEERPKGRLSHGLLSFGVRYTGDKRIHLSQITRQMPACREMYRDVF